MSRVPPSTTLSMLSKFDTLIDILNYKNALTSFRAPKSINGITIQYHLHNLLVKHNYGGVWIKECRIKPLMGEQYKDKIDILGTFARFKVIIEIDTSRADQVGKKMASRMAVYCDEPILYVAICYPGTPKMRVNECIKYFEYGKRLINHFSNGSTFLGVIIEKTTFKLSKHY